MDNDWIDAWVDSIPDNPYDPCPCGCGKKFRFALKEGLEVHETRFKENFQKEHPESSDNLAT